MSNHRYKYLDEDKVVYAKTDLCTQCAAEDDEIVDGLKDGSITDEGESIAACDRCEE